MWCSRPTGAPTPLPATCRGSKFVGFGPDASAADRSARLAASPRPPSGSSRRGGCCGACRPMRWSGSAAIARSRHMLAAIRLGIPTAIHEQNAVLGRANRLLAGRVSRIATGFAATAGLRPADKARVVHTGNPGAARGAGGCRGRLLAAAVRRAGRTADYRRQPGGANFRRCRAGSARFPAAEPARRAARQPTGAAGGLRAGNRATEGGRRSPPRSAAFSPTSQRGWRGRIW